MVMKKRKRMLEIAESQRHNSQRKEDNLSPNTCSQLSIDTERKNVFCSSEICPSIVMYKK